MSISWQAMEHYEYYLNNPHEDHGEFDLEEYEEQLHEEIVEYMDSLDGGDFMDFAYGGGKEEFQAALDTIKSMALAAYDGNDEDLLVFAKSLTKRMIDRISDYVEREKM